MFRTIVVLATFFSVLTNSYAQTLSSQCMDAWRSLAADPAASGCLSVQQALPLGTVKADESVVSIMNNWFTSMCNQPACNPRTITAIHKLLVDKCSALDKWDQFDPTVYPTWRKATCLKKANSMLCLTEFLSSVEAYSGTVTFSKFHQIIDQAASLPANIVCTDCQKANYNLWTNELPAAVVGAAPVLRSLCGAAFVDGKPPTGVTQSANTAISTVTTTLGA